MNVNDLPITILTWHYQINMQERGWIFILWFTYTYTYWPIHQRGLSCNIVHYWKQWGKPIVPIVWERRSLTYEKKRLQLNGTIFMKRSKWYLPYGKRNRWRWRPGLDTNSTVKRSNLSILNYSRFRPTPPPPPKPTPKECAKCLLSFRHNYRSITTTPRWNKASKKSLAP